MTVRLRFRTVLVSVTLALLLATVGVIGVTSFLSGRDAARELSGQVIEQTAERIDTQIKNELDVAIGEATLDRLRLLGGRVDPLDREAVSAHLIDAITAHPQLSYLSWTRDSNGDLVNVERERDGSRSVTFLIRQPDDRLELHHYAIAADNTRTEVEWFPDKPKNDGRPRPYYVAAVAAGAPTWTETYVFLGKSGSLTVPGVTRATPVTGPDGKLLGVLSADFDLYALSEFLGNLKIGKHGMAFLVELRADGTDRVIAHADPALLADAQGNAIPADRVADPRVHALVPLIDRTVKPSAGLVPVELDIAGTHYLGGYRRIDGDRGLHWVVAIAMPASDILGPVEEARRTTIIITIIATIVAIVLAIVLAMQIGGALRRLAHETEAIGKFHLAAKPVVDSSVVEVRQLSAAIEDMKRGLRSFQKFVPADLVRRLVESGHEAAAGGKRETITMHFSDLADFTTISEKLAPEELTELLSEYLEFMAHEILASGGTIDKYIGDAVMAFWNAPRTVEDHAFIACKTVLASQRKLGAKRVEWTAAGKPALRCRVGLHTGDAVVGNIGSSARLDYTAIGDTVNLASRLEGLNKTYGTEIMISESTYALVADRVVVRLLDRVAVKGKAASIAIYELVGLAGEVDAATLEAAARHDRAMTAYFERRWDDALALLGDDDAGKLIAARIAVFKESPPPADWDGVHRMTTK